MTSRGGQDGRVDEAEEATISTAQTARPLAGATPTWVASMPQRRRPRAGGRALLITVVAVLLVSCGGSETSQEDATDRAAEAGETLQEDAAEGPAAEDEAAEDEATYEDGSDRAGAEGTAIDTAQAWVDALTEGRCTDAIELTEFMVGTARGFRGSCEDSNHGPTVVFRSSSELFQTMREIGDISRAEICEEDPALCVYDEVWVVTEAPTFEDCNVEGGVECTWVPLVARTTEGWRVLNQNEDPGPPEPPEDTIP